MTWTEMFHQLGVKIPQMEFSSANVARLLKCKLNRPLTFQTETLNWEVF